jgi:serine/threonine protein kinase
VADFGIKKAVAYPVDQKAKWLFDASSLYAPAEVLMGEEPSFRSDIYQVGLLIFLMLTGQLPLRNKQDLKFVVEKMKDEPLLPSQLNGKAPKYLDEIVFRCLEKDPLMRFGSVEELSECLRSKSVPPRNRTFIDMLEIDYSEEPVAKKEEEPAEELLEIVPEKKPQKEIRILEDRRFEEKNEEINMFKWVFMAVWLAIAAGIIYSLINIILIGE